MKKPSSLSIWQAGAAALAYGRSTEEQLDAVRKCGNHAVTPVLRTRLLAGLGVPRPKEQAEHCVVFGCYRPFADPYLVRDYIRVLELLKVDYTYLDQEQCCGMPFAMMPRSADRDAALAESVAFNKQNDEQATRKGAKKLAYCCMGCAYAARNAAPDAQDRHVYLPDLIFDQLGQRQLAVKPMRVGYFEGCHSFARSAYPAGSFDWSRYRKQLQAVDGLTIIDLQKDRCCKNSADEIVGRALEMDAATVVCPCNSCASSIGLAGQGKITMMSLPELLLEILA
ncbi:(Fe-S)-binding protein [Desulfobulbus sp.]|uniref:(Fe-S)-binding protein n=1 Tax=Desulfobulbus sp. TaxID=895 RepID=UPI0027BA37CE|nr:(Fe-S)-binding protein [Desulfobulbus sp.]